MKRKFLITISFCLFVFLSNEVFSQTSISGVINSYTVVDSIFSNKDSILVADASAFSASDTVMIYQAKGAIPGTDITSNIHLFGTIRDAGDEKSAGKYEIILVKEIKGDTVIFKALLNNDYSTKDLVQLIRVPSYKSANVEGELTCKAWEDTTGGILALMVSDTLFLNADINVAGKGFRGAVPFKSNGNCASKDSALYESYYFNENTPAISAGYKGEGVAMYDTTYSKGLGRWVNGGGGGNARFAGGGGGSNDVVGGKGGAEDTVFCANTPLYDGDGWGGLGGSAGFGLGSLDLIKSNTIFLGGGGGSGTYMDGFIATPGGNGGGIVIIIAKVIISDGANIFANGVSVTDIASASGGGGGGGGTVSFDVDSVIGDLKIYTNGGDGSSVAINGKSGPGGGGGGGPVLWSRSEPNYDFTWNNLGGAAGYAKDLWPDLETNGAFSGDDGTSKPNLNSPLTGFLFNSITANQQVCYNSIPDLISGSEPRGGNGTFAFQWQKSPNGIDSWSVITDSIRRDFQPPALTDTIYYQRIVTSGSVVDEGNVVEIIVHNYVSGNFILGDDLFTCLENEADTITGTTVVIGSGGDNIKYQYIWESSTDLSSWGTITEIDSVTCLPGTILDTTYVRRVVISGACYDTTANIEIIGLPKISNNVLSTDQEICKGQEPEVIIGGEPGNGLGIGSYVISWEEKTESSGWTLIADSIRKDLAPSNLIETMYYRRTVQSHDCFDISDEIKINVLEPIDKDSIVTNSLIYTCYNTPPQIIDGSTPINGDGINYDFQWQKSFNGISWIDIPDSDVEDYQAEALTVKTYFRRLVSSGQDGCCTSHTDSIIIDIYPLPISLILPDRDSTCSGDEINLDFRIRSGKAPYALTYHDGYNDFLISTINDTISNPQVYPETELKSKQFDYTLVSVIDANLCEATDLSGTHTAIVHGIPNAFAGDDDEFCQLTYPLLAIPSSIAEGVWIQNSGAGTSVFDPDALFATANLTVTLADKYSFIWTETNWKCIDSDTVNLTLYQPPYDIKLSPEDTILYFVDEMNLKGSVVNPDTFSLVTRWDFIEGSAQIAPNANASSISLSGLNDLGNPKIIFTWTVEKGACEDSVAQGTIGLKELFTPNGFTPNGDGVNDYLKFNGLENTDENELIIYNRWGTEVYREKNYSNDMGWEGKKKNGNDLPEDTYFYILNVTDDGVLQTHKGFIVLKRY